MALSVQTRLRLLRIKHWLMAQGVAAMLGFMKLLPPKQATNTIAWISRTIGPLTSRHKIALNNLALAMPDVPETKRREIALGMWSNMGRLAAEYVYLDQLFDFDP